MSGKAHVAHLNDPFGASRFVRVGRQLAAFEEASQCPSLPWPTNLYGDNMTIAELMADGDYRTPKIGRVAEHLKCSCGCGGLHNNGASVTRRNDCGSWTVTWYKVGHTVRRR